MPPTSHEHHHLVKKGELTEIGRFVIECFTTKVDLTTQTIQQPSTKNFSLGNGYGI
jgi:hypothetical protein